MSHFRNILRKVRKFFLLIVIIPAIILILIEFALRISEVDTDTLKSKTYNISVPVWVSNDINFNAAAAFYKGILDNQLSPSTAEWMECFEEAKYVRHKLKPNIFVNVSNTINRMELKKGIKVLFQSNSEGFRTDEIPEQKMENEYRIVLLGDSSTFGWGVNQDERFSHFLEQKLNSSQNRIHYTIINLGIPGYTSDHGKAVFDHYALDYDPDMVICSFGANDGRPIHKTAKEMLKGNSWYEDVKFFLLKFKTYKLIRKIALSNYNPIDKIQEEIGKDEELEPFVTEEEYRDNLEYIITKGRERGIETVLLGLCCPFNYLVVMGDISKEMNVHFMDGMYIMIQSLPLVQGGALYPEMTQHYRQLYRERNLEKRRILYVTSDSCHPNILGHQIIADTIFDRVFLERMDF